MAEKVKKIQRVFIVYWILLAYIIAALVWWYIALSRQANQMALLKIKALVETDKVAQKIIEAERKRKTAQYLGEGATFLLLIVAGAVFVFKAVNRQLTLSQHQQNFMIAITHELKTPIAVAKLNLETMQLRKLDEQQQLKLLQNTLQETNRLNDLCNNMLLSSQIEAGGYRMVNETINAGTLVTNCTHDFIIRYPGRHILVEVTDDANITGDGLLLEIAVNNLLENAIKYSPRESPVKVKLYKTTECLRLEITDEGTGISDTEKKKVFEKFYRLGNEATKRAKGTGLGLYLTKRIISAHYGKIFITDNAGAGSTFVVEFKSSS
ncbi:MAG TPA: ATP-binding protein [Ferruginibacter sp.]|nr:ATP-binding protein [Ferruginibacter sp.]